MSESPLADLKVLDLSQWISGPFCTKLLADFGAEVIKIENPKGGDPLRRLGPFPGETSDPEKSGLFLYLNTNKKSITLNLKLEAGVKIFKQLVQEADIVVENFEPGFMSELGLDYETLQELRPSLILTSISYFGQNGPYRDYKGADIIAQALGGIMALTGLPEREPLKIAGPQAEYQAGLNAAVATMTALYFRDETGLGQHIDVAVMEVMASILEGALLSYAYNKVTRKRAGARHPLVYPSTILPCRDGYVHVHAGTDWETFAYFLNLPQLLNYQPGEARQKAEEIDALLKPWLQERGREEIFQQAQEWRFPFAMVLKPEQLLEDPQFQERKFFVQTEHPIAGQVIYPGAPFKLSEGNWRAGRAPLLGEHNEEIYCYRLGYTGQDLARLKEEGII